MTENDKMVDILNRLIEVNMDRREGYLNASENTDDVSLKAVFDKYAEISGKYKADLDLAVQYYGGTPAEKTTFGGDIYRAWMDVKNALSTNEREAILESCEHGEDSALITYRNVLEDGEGIDNNTLSTITMQLNNLEKAYDHIKALRYNA